MFPTEYLSRMKALLNEEYDDYLRSLETGAYKALRLNPLKADEAQLLVLLNKYIGVDDRVPWEPLGYYYSEDEQEQGKAMMPPGKNPLHEAGMYYIQEPSAMLPAARMMAGGGERILDLCAAPGGKTTQTASYMNGRGVLVCNEIVASRARILSENVERMGVRNALVLNETPQKLRDSFVDYFDRILVDAPCSGEGMFRKNEQAQDEWSVDNVRMCAERQDEILDCAATMLKPGGMMVYSTCTFSKEEDEECIERFLGRHPDYKLGGEEKLFPHRIRGEGHFAACLVREGTTDASGYCSCGTFDGVRITDYLQDSDRDRNKSRSKGRDKNRGRDNGGSEAGRKAFGEFCRDVLTEEAIAHLNGRLLWYGENLYLMPEGAPGIDGLKVLRPGLWLGTFKKERFEPSHALALALRPEEARNKVDITLKTAIGFIAGMTIDNEKNDKECGEDLRGWVLVCCEGISLGWGKAVGNTIKNHYPKGLRKQL